MRVRRSPLLPALLATALLVVGGCADGSTAGPADSSSTRPAAAAPTASHRAAPLDWAPCHGSGLSGLQCATLQVPLDYSDSAKGTIGIALDRQQASGTKIGSLLVNPGGPGVSGVTELPGIIGLLSSTLLEHFDIIGFDPRGVGASAPITCETNDGFQQYLHLDPAPPTTAGFDALVTGDREFAAGCEARSGRVLPYVSTANAARDMDRIRAAVGDAKLNYLGFSYGTFLGATYAELFPTHVRAMVLDGALDPALTQLQLVEQQSTSLDQQFLAFAQACSSDTNCPWKPGANADQTMEALVAKVRAHPLDVSGTSQSVGPSEMLYGAAEALYTPASWPTLESALAAATEGDGSQILQLFDDYVDRSPNGAYDNSLEAETAINCLDSPAPTLAQILAAAPSTEASAPVFGLLDLYSEASCTVWPVPATGQTGPISAPGSPPIVVVGSTGDPITPYAWAQALASQLPNGVLLTRDGDGHTGYEFSSCVRSDLDTYFMSLRPPAAGTTCPTDD